MDHHGVMRQNPDGTWSPAEPMGWQEEHGWFARLIFRRRGIPHCSDEAHARSIARDARRKTDPR